MHHALGLHIHYFTRRLWTLLYIT